MRRTALLAIVLALVTFSSQAAAQCTHDGCVGPCLAQNLIVDPSFKSGCPNWVFNGSVQTKTDGGICSGGGPYAQFSGGYGTLSQVVYPTVGLTYEFSYILQFENAQPTYWQALDVYLYDADTGQQIMRVDSVNGYAGNLYCMRRDISLGSHPEWAGRNLEIRIQGYAYYGAVFKVTAIAFWEYFY